nr:glycine-rich RNA-binding protein-like [Aegilops tauschii subsp. strangulata]
MAAVAMVMEEEKEHGGGFALDERGGDELAAAGRGIGEEELLSFIIAGLDMDYQPIISALNVRTDPVSVDEPFAMVANFDQRVELFHGSGAGGFKSSANMAARNHGGGGKGNNLGSPKPTNGDGGYRGGGSNSNGSGGNTNSNYNNGGGGSFYNNSNNHGRPFYNNNQGHQRGYGGGYGGNYGGGNNFQDTGATEHITPDMERMTMQEKYHGHDQINTAANGQGLGHAEGSLLR